MELVERLPLKKLYWLNEMSYKTFKANKYYSNKCKNEADRQHQYELMKNYTAGMIKAKGEMRRFYSYSQSTPLQSEGGGGRLYCGNSIQCLPKKIRGFLLQGITTDIDQKNSSPTILRYICKLNKWDCPELEYYLNHTAELRERYNKMDFINCITDCKKLKNAVDFLKDYDDEIKGLVKKIVELDKYSVQVKSVPDLKKYNREGSAISRILGYYENEILQVALSILNRKNIELFAPFFDGCEPYGDHYNNQELLNEITQAVEEKFEGLNMGWAFKEHCNEIEMPEDYEIPELKERRANKDLTFVSNENEATDILYEILKDSLKYSQGKLYYKHNHLWFNDAKEIEGILNQYVMNSKIYKTNDKDDIIDFVQNRKVAVNVSKSIIEKAVTFKEDDWFNKSVKSSLGKILFKNGYYSFTEKLFYPFDHKDYNHSIVFFEQIPYDFGKLTPEEEKKRDEIKEQLFTKPFGEELGNYYILNIARALAGDEMKRILFGIGSGNTGKSMMTAAIKSSCGGYYGAFSAVNIAYNKSSADDASKLRWIMLLQTKRIIISNEIQSNIELDGNMLKKISNGGYDDIVARGLFEKETSFKVSFLPIIFANDLDKIKPIDDALINRIRGIPYTKVFVDKKAEECNEFELPIDEGLKNDIETLTFKRAFMALLTRAYNDYKTTNKGDEKEPTDLKSLTASVVGDIQDIIKKFLCDYDITNNENDKVLSSDIENWLKGTNISMTKFGRDMNKYAKLNNFENVYSKPIKIGGGKTKQHWVGIKRLVETEEEK